MRPILSVLLLGASAHSQTLFDYGRQLEQQRLEAHHKLRQAIIELRNIRAVSCRLGNALDCDLAALTDVELLLLDVEGKYGSRGSHDLADKAKKAADDARSKVSDLIDVLKER